MIIGQNGMVDISFLKKCLEVSKTVCRIVRHSHSKPEPIGTGFLIGPGLIMTCHHVIPSVEECSNLLAEFEFERDASGAFVNSFFFLFNPQSLFITNNELDYTIIGIEPTAINDSNKILDSYGYNKLVTSASPILTGERVFIIQHPNGLSKQISLMENKVIHFDESTLHYSSDTQRGSSGSLVANEQWEIIAIHKGAVPLMNVNGESLSKDNKIIKKPKEDKIVNWVANEGVLINKILEDIQLKNIDNQELINLFKVYYSQLDKLKEFKLPTRKLTHSTKAQAQCFMATKRGARCKRLSKEGFKYCTQHLKIKNNKMK